MKGSVDSGWKSKLHTKRSYLWGALVIGLIVGAGALGRASVPHTFNAGDTLAAADLNGNFAALDQRLAALEAKDPFAGTYPAVQGQGSASWFCGSPPATLNLSPGPTTVATLTYSDGFGNIIFTNAGAVSVNLSLGATAPECPAPSLTVCAGPLTFYLKSPVDQTITIHGFVDNTGAVYVNGAQRATSANGPISLSYNAVANASFSVSFIGCSSDGPSIGFAVLDTFITTYGLLVDYDATFHRNGK